MRVATVADMTEREWQADVVKLAHMLGYRRVYHTHDSRRSQHGFPDLVVVRDRIVFLELKREGGKLTDPQRDWLGALVRAGGEAYVVRPAQLQEVADMLAGRGSGRERLVAATASELGLEPEPPP